MFTISAPRITIRFVALLTAVSLVLSAFPAAFFVANAQEVPAEVPTTETPVEEVTTPVENTDEPADEPADELPQEPVEEVAKAAASIVIDEPVASARLVADKIICDDESDLPNWGSTTENPDITADTAEDWVEAHEGCYFAKGWEFEWAPYGSTGNPGDTLVGPAGAPWTTFSYSTTIPESAFETGIWVREVLQAGYIPFTYNPGKVNTNDVSAEIYCNADVLNYDNFDYVGGIEPESTYYCVAWNVLAEEPVETCSLTIKSDTSNVVVERDANAFETWVHPNWIQTLPLAKWIWADATTQQPRTGEQYTFENKFGWNPAATVTDVTLKIAADNLYNASLNGGLVADEITPNNINQFSALDTYVLPTNTILDGNNVFSSVVKNVPWNTDFAKTNPGGLYYELVITGEGAADCLVPYEEPEEPEEMYEITGTKWNDANGNGTREEGEEGLAGWTIVAEYGENSISTTTDANGDYTLWVPEGEWSVREVQQEGWYQTSTRQNGDYIYETYSCSFDFSDEPVLYKSLSSELLDIEVVIDGNTCDFGNHYYYETITACKLDENKNPVAGWGMGIQSLETEQIFEVITGEDGCVSVDVDPNDGPWIVAEEMKEGWSQIEAEVNNGDRYAPEGGNQYCVFFDYEASRAEASELQVVDQDYDYSRTCTFINKAPEKKNGSSSSGTRTKRPQGQVLGATTQCGLWLNDFMQKATVNDTYQVLKLQVFLTLQGYATPLTGIFDDTTEANVKLFQAKYADTVIKPWFEKGIVPHNRPTGFVYKTTRWQINDIMCPGIEAYPSFEGENLSTNVLINR